jgi:hypothetical protein
MTRTSIDLRMINPHQEDMNMTKYAKTRINYTRTVWFDPEVLVKVEAEREGGFYLGLRSSSQGNFA